MVGIKLDWNDLEGGTLGEKIDTVMNTLSPLLKSGDKISFTYKPLLNPARAGGDENDKPG